MDIQRPIPNQKLRADWGRAVADAAAAGSPAAAPPYPPRLLD